MKYRLTSLLFLLLFGFGLSLARPLRAESTPTIEGLVYAGEMIGMSEEKFNSILNAESVKYVLFQVIRPHRNVDLDGALAVMRRRVAALKERGKKPIVQIWWGGGRTYWSWEFWSLPNISQSGPLRASFFAQVTDPIIEALGPENLYGVHLMEEVGIQFGSDSITHPQACGPAIIPAACLPDRFSAGCPEAFRDGDRALSGLPDGDPLLSSYKAPRYRSLSSDPVNYGRRMCNVKRYRRLFQQETDQGFVAAPDWLLDQWVGRRLISQAELFFAHHIHAQYPGLKVYSWNLPPLNSSTVLGDISLIAPHVDGFIMNPFVYPGIAYRVGRFFRLLAPDKELLYVSAIREDATPHTLQEKRMLATVAYLLGADAFGYFDYPWLTNMGVGPASFAESLTVLDKLKTIPVLKSDPRILVISKRTWDGNSDPFLLTFLKKFDYASPLQVSTIDLSKYEMVVLFEGQGGGSPGSGPSTGSLQHWDSAHMNRSYGGFGAEFDGDELDRYVREGGLLAVIGGWDLGNQRPSFSKNYIVFDRFYYDAVREQSMQLTGNWEEILSPDPWFTQNFQIRRGTSYAAAFRRKIVRLVESPPSAVHPFDPDDPALGIYYQRGSGGVLILPTNFERRERPWTIERDGRTWSNDAMYHGNRRYLSDLLCGMALFHGKDELRNEMFCTSPGEAVEFSGALTDRSNHPDPGRGEIEAAVVLSGSIRPPASRCSGLDLWTGEMSPLLTSESMAYLCSIEPRPPMPQSDDPVSVNEAGDVVSAGAVEINDASEAEPDETATNADKGDSDPETGAPRWPIAKPFGGGGCSRIRR